MNGGGEQATKKRPRSDSPHSVKSPKSEKRVRSESAPKEKAVSKARASRNPAPETPAPKSPEPSDPPTPSPRRGSNPRVGRKQYSMLQGKRGPPSEAAASAEIDETMAEVPDENGDWEGEGWEGEGWEGEGWEGEGIDGIPLAEVELEGLGEEFPDDPDHPNGCDGDVEGEEEEQVQDDEEE